MNSFHTITLYRLSSDIWGFDDEAHGIIGEPFVGEMNGILDRLLKNCNAKGTTLTFGGTPFPDSHTFEWKSGDEFGNWYECDGITGWLCPTLLVYFEKPPQQIFIRAT